MGTGFLPYNDVIFQQSLGGSGFFIERDDALRPITDGRSV
jgi:hypothetical protein